MLLFLISLLFLVAVLVFTVVCLIVTNIGFRKTAYHKITHNTLLETKWDTGKNGEYLTYRKLRALEKQGGRFLFNCYLPKNTNETTEVDVILLHTSGVFVFESKNYSGWIFGDENAQNWTQTLPQGKGRKARKEHFLNPIKQNQLHIKWLKKLVGDTFPIYSVIVFSERCTLKKVDVQSDQAIVVKRDALWQAVQACISKTENKLTPTAVQELYEELYPYTQTTEEEKQKHIDNIYARHTSKQNPESNDSVSKNAARQADNYTLYCPRCGGELVPRIAKKGEHAGDIFYGCENFPRCRYTRKV